MNQSVFLKYSILFFIFYSSIASSYYSQYNQDQYILTHLFPNKKNGFFIDIGAFDGITWSNTLALEQRGWNGICFEPNPDEFKKLKKCRKCICIQGCVDEIEGPAQFLQVVGGPMLDGLVERYDARHLENIQKLAQEKNLTFKTIEVQRYLLNNILDQYQIKHIDVLCIDIEGGEFTILKSIDWNRFVLMY